MRWEDSILKKLKEISEETGKIIKSYYRQFSAGDFEKKGFSHFVTEADREAESFIIENLKENFPGKGIQSEEIGWIEGESRFIVDPLDGTHNFMHGVPHFCISIAFEEEGEIIYGVIHDPIKMETFSAEKGGGTFLNGEKVVVSGIEEVEKALVTMGLPPAAYDRRNRVMDALKKLIIQVNSLRIFGSAALQLAGIACGRIDGDIELGLSPWDLAAGSLLIKEAGGIITDINRGDKILEGNIIAGTPAIYEFLYGFFEENIKN